MVLRGIIRFGLLAVLSATGACAPSPKSSPPTTVVASLVGSPPAAVEVQVENLPSSHRIERILLIDREGRELEATEFETSPEPVARRRPLWPVYSYGVTDSSSMIIGFRRAKARTPEEPGSAAALIPLHDREVYLADPGAWTVVVEGAHHDGAPLSYRVPAPRLPRADGGTPATGVVRPQGPRP